MHGSQLQFCQIRWRELADQIKIWNLACVTLRMCRLRVIKRTAVLVTGARYPCLLAPPPDVLNQIRLTARCRRVKFSLVSSAWQKPRLPIIHRCAAMAGVLKKTTGLVGLAVVHNPHERLRILYAKILATLQTIPKDAAYRKYTEQIINERFSAVKTEPDVQKLEERFNCGQIEEVIVQAEHELSLARKMKEWKPWEPLIEEPPANQWKWPI
ncbi:hypothetical protein NDU88_001719 [Pleurodeles waltl]|uniref:NADH dehydrogenase [ubiquinone] 1 alpha subcomplex subunit 5 n=2 Tax=Pleurodeles waltl TaxID=8319 RepID=A0AAV7S9K2_PLEWA|nr:hypothetical protein NDU88_001719 [Pleurodeles waltl]